MQLFKQQTSDPLLHRGDNRIDLGNFGFQLFVVGGVGFRGWLFFCGVVLLSFLVLRFLFLGSLVFAFAFACCSQAVVAAVRFLCRLMMSHQPRLLRYMA